MTVVRPNQSVARPATTRCSWCGAATVPGGTCARCTPRYLDPPTEPIVLGGPGRPGLGLWVLIAVLVALLAVGGLGVVRPDLLGLRADSLFWAGGEPPPGSSSTDVPSPEPVASAAPAAASGEDGLRQAAEADRADVEATAGSWVPQLASKRPGTVDGGRRYGADDVLAEYRALRAQHPQARLLWSGDWPVFSVGDYWVTVLAEPTSSAAGANAWCDEQGISADHCFAKRLSHSGSSRGSTVPR